MTPNPRREEILDATLRLVRRHGLGKLTIRRIAQAVEVTEGALYRHFSGKSAIVLALIDKLDALLIDPLERIAADLGSSPADRLRRMLRHHATLIEQTDSLPILLLAEVVASGDEALVARMRQTYESYIALLENLLRESGPPSGTIDPRQAALSLLGLMSAFAIGNRLGGRGGIPVPTDAIDDLVDHFTEDEG